MLKIGRRFACALVAATAFAAPAWAQSTLKVALHSDLKIIDPVWTTALISTHHGYMVYDTLFALDGKLEVKPQMVDKWQVSPDKLTWTFTLRDGLEWHDGKPVTSEDCVASIKRWGAKDSMGQKLMSVVADLSAPTPRPSRWREGIYGLRECSASRARTCVMMPRRSPMAIRTARSPTPRLQCSFKKDEWKQVEKAFTSRTWHKPARAAFPRRRQVCQGRPAEWIAILTSKPRSTR
jgi:peptide/nickel transport system substrate-binding protein